MWPINEANHLLFVMHSCLLAHTCGSLAYPSYMHLLSGIGSLLWSHTASQANLTLGPFINLLGFCFGNFYITLIIFNYYIYV